MADRLARIAKIHDEKFGAGDIVAFRAPGRVNLIGEHTDYNDGFVLPCAISRDVIFAGAPAVGRVASLYSVNFGEAAEINLAAPFNPGKPRWANYVDGVLRTLEESAGVEIGGFSAVIDGNVPLGAGLSSSAALDVAAGIFACGLFGVEVSPEELARICQRADHRFIGIKCGIMDQFASRLCRENHALFLDCRSLEYEHIPLDLRKHEIMILDTGVSRELADSAYNERRETCARGVELLRGAELDVKALRDVSSEEFSTASADWDSALRAACGHVVEENERVLSGVECLRKNDIAAFGELLYLSHESLRDKYKVSCGELDVLVDGSRVLPGVAGARMTGAGFGGCAVALVEREFTDDYEKRITAIYREKTGRELKIYRSLPADGAGRVEIRPR